MTTVERASLLANYCQNEVTENHIGYFAAIDLIQWLKHELGSAEILDRFQPVRENLQSKAIPNGPILHILSGNTAHAGLQSLLRGILIGAENWIKLPSSGLPVVEKWINALPNELKKFATVIDSVDESIIDARTVIAIGSDETMDVIHKKMTPFQRFIPHGHKLSIGLIDQPSAKAAELVVKDSCAFNQQGCLSLHTIYVNHNARDFLPLLAEAMAHYETQNPRGNISLSESGAITNLRETIRYESANDPENHAIIHSEKNTSWTAIYRNSPTLTPSPLNRVISIQPWPEDTEKLGSEYSYISTLAIEEKFAIMKKLTTLEFPRICLLGKSQQPSLFWHHDGFAPLSSLVKWRDIEL